jgi:hypothetical protein
LPAITGPPVEQRGRQRASAVSCGWMATRPIALLPGSTPSEMPVRFSSRWQACRSDSCPRGRGGRPGPRLVAHSVAEGNAGRIHIEINRPEDATGLERALQEHGIAADIAYLPELQRCAQVRYSVVDRKFVGM